MLRKKFFVVLVFLVAALLFFSGCTKPPSNYTSLAGRHPESFLLELKFNEGEKLTNTVHSEYKLPGQEIELQTTVVTTVKEVTGEYAVMHGRLTESVRTINGEEEDLFSQLSEEQKQSEYKLYFNGAMDLGEEVKTNFYLPKQEFSLADSYEFGGLTYTLEETVSVAVGGKPVNAIKISFKGKREGTTSVVNGYLLFDYENGKIIKTVSKGKLIITNELTKIE